MKKLLTLMCVISFFAALASMSGAVSNGDGLYPFTRRHMQMNYGQIVCLRVLDSADVLPGQFGWVTWNGVASAENLAASLEPPGNAPETYCNPGTPENGWTPDFNDHVIAIGKWMQGIPGKVNVEEVRTWLDWHITHKTPMVIPLYDAATEQGSRAYYRVASFAAFEIQSHEVSGQHPCITGKFLRWVTNGNWVQ